MDSRLKGLLDFGPLLLFFFANARWGIVAATAAFMVAIGIALAVSYWKTREVSTMQLVTGGVVLVFGGLTVVSRNDTFIKLKPTIVNALFGAVLLGGVARGRSLLQPLLGSVMRLSAQGWRALSIRWGCFFLAMAVLNEAVWRNVSTDAWVTFKVFGFLPLTLLFTMSQIPLMTRHALEDEAG